VGDLADPSAIDRLERAIDGMGRRLGVQPELVAHDLHPDYHGSRFARSLGLPTLAVQHHHAHALACLAENGHEGPALALTLDGAGYGSDGASWGGELLWVNGLEFRRMAHLTPLPLPGGDRAAREPWRMAIAALVAAGEELQAEADEFVRSLETTDPCVPADVARAVVSIASRPDACPTTTSAGRWFDAVASLLGLCHVNTREAEAAMALERSAADGFGQPQLPIQIQRPGPDGRTWEIDLRPAIQDLVRRRYQGTEAPVLALGFHAMLAAGLVRAATFGAAVTGVQEVALTGGVMLNRLLGGLLESRLEEEGLRPMTHHRIPPGDGGLAMGQAWAGILSAPAT